MLAKIVSGGATGADRAALDVALELGLHCGGWCPHGHIADDGRVYHGYHLAATPSASYRQCTEWNVRDSDATLILAGSRRLAGGTRNTLAFALKRHRKPALVLQLRDGEQRRRVRRWLRQHRIRVLNVAGPRERKRPGIYREARRLLRAVLK
jgi:Circularly permutated YpsA SLOG family